jgi:hypothetical protein
MKHQPWPIKGTFEKLELTPKQRGREKKIPKKKSKASSAT